MPMASPPVYEFPEPKHSSWRVWTPATLTSTVFGLRTLTINVRSVRQSPISRKTAWNWEGDHVHFQRSGVSGSMHVGTTDIRLDVKFSVDMTADPHKVQQLALDTIKSVPRVLMEPPPACHFMGFGNKALDFSLRFWINDPIEGSTNVKSAALLALWDAFKREGVDLPSAVQDMRLQGPVRVVSGDYSEK